VFIHERDRGPKTERKDVFGEHRRKGEKGQAGGSLRKVNRGGVALVNKITHVWGKKGRKIFIPRKKNTGGNYLKPDVR